MASAFAGVAEKVVAKIAKDVRAKRLINLDIMIKGLEISARFCGRTAQ